VKEIVSTLDPNNVSLLPQNKFHLLTEWEGKTLVSQALIAKPDKEKEKEENKPTNVILTESESNEDFGVFGNLTLTRSFKGAMAILSITPTYVFHNSTPYDLHVSASLFHPDTHRAQTGLHTPLVIEHVPSQTSMPLSFCEHIEMEGTGETVQALSLRTSCEDRRWSLPLSSDFVRHSFALPTSNEIYLKAVLTMHEHSNTIYMVASIDPSPRLLIQNHTQQHLEIVEESTGGVHSFPQKLPPAQEVSYEPPTYAKQYPIVFDDEVTHSEAVNQTKEKLARVVVKFRLDRTQLDAEDEGTEMEWSDPFYLSSGSDRVISIPEGNSMLVSTHKRGTTLHLSLLPTGPAVSFLPISNTTEVDSPISRVNVEMAIDLRLEQMVVCIDDETTEDFELIQEILQVIVDGAALQFSSGVGSDGSSLELTVDSFHINNMMERDGGAFAVTVIPRAHHHRRASLIDSEPTPLASLSVHYSPHSPNLIELIRISLRPLTLQLEDELLNRLKCVVTSFSNPGVLRTPLPGRKNRQGSTVTPKLVLAEAERDVIPLAVTKLVIESAAFYLNARISLRVLLSCNDSPFRFSRYELRNIYSNWTEVSQTVASRYVMSTIAHIGWLLGSLELIGSPGTFIQNVGRGLRDLVTLPYQGLTRSPTWFLLGIGQGTMSFIQHFSSGALGSVTSMASSISHNMERLSLDPHHVSYQTQQRQQRPATHFTRGLVSGVSSLGLSLMSAVAGIVEQPMQSYHQIEGPASPAVAARSILKGVGKGLLGAVTKPVGGVMELVSQTGQGLMHGTGLAKRLSHKPVKVQSFTGSVTRISLQCSSTACAV
jgi:vacuolar protein sorting-associated protein 13B